MTLPVQNTKLHFPPPRTRLVSRARLVGQLQEGLKRPLTLISAPAGYGKTTLLAEWRIDAGRDFPAAWLSLDEDDNDLSGFLNYLAIALETAGTGLAGNTLLLLQSPTPPVAEKVLTSLVEDLSGYPNELAIILDDYHMIDSNPIHDALRFLLERLPPHVHLILLTRTDPPLPLARLRVRNELMEIRTADLRFTMQETASFLNELMELGLSAEDVAALEARTEGWIAGLQLAALSMQRRSDIHSFISAFTGSHRYVVDYLAEEVLHRQNDEVRDFLLKTSILNRLSAPLCDALTGGSNGQAMLEHLERSNLFLAPLDDERHWYRYHHLFADVLRNRLQHTQPDMLPELYRRAIAWYEKNDLIDQAVTHALAVKEFEYAADLITRQWRNLLVRGQARATIVQWIGTLPQNLLMNSPRLCMVEAWLLLSAGRIPAARTYLGYAEQALSQPSRALDADGESLPSEVLAFKAFDAISQNDFDESLQLSQQALALAPENALFARSYIHVAQSTTFLEVGQMNDALRSAEQALLCARAGGTPGGTVSAVRDMGTALKLQGQLHRALDVYREALQYAEAETQDRYPQYGQTYISMADVFYQWNDLDRAQRYVSIGLQLAEQGGDLMEIVNARLAMIRLRYAQGDHHAALDLLQSLVPLFQHKTGITELKEFAAPRARWQATLGQTVEAIEWLAQIDLTIPDRIGLHRGIALFNAARVMLVTNRLDDVPALLSKIESAVHNGGNLSWEIEALVLQSVIWRKNGDFARALTCVEKALSLGEKEGFIRVFLDEGEPMVDILRKSASRFASRLLDSVSTRVSKPLLISAPPGLIEPLSDRELEVLKLIASGRLNKEIGDELYIAIGTVKRHTANIFRKLDVINRTQAVARSRELGLL